MRSLLVMFSLVVASVVDLAAQSTAPDRWLPPDSATLSRLQGRLANRGRIRVFADLTPIEIHSPAVDTAGIRSGRDPGQAPLAWSEVSRVQVRTSAFLRGVVIGSVVGGSLGLLAGVSAAHECSGTFLEWCGAGAGDVVALTAVSALAFGFVGGLVSAPFGRWATVYQAQQRPWTPTVTLSPMPRGRFGVNASLSF